MSEVSCLVHYGSIKTANTLTKVSEASFQTLVECKSIRVRLGGENSHDEQCSRIPESFEEKELYYHRECYQKFTYAKTLLKRKVNQDGGASTSKRSQRLPRNALRTDECPNRDSRGRFPDHCMICKKTAIKVKGKRQVLTKIVTKSAEITLKQAAKLRNDEEMLIAVQDVDLIAKDFQRHEYCYREYTRLVWDKGQNENIETTGRFGNFEAVCEVVDDHIIGGRQCISMEYLMGAYGIGTGVRQRRHALKERLLKKYGDCLLFISTEYHTSQVVISRECLETQTISKSLEFSEDYAVKRAASLLHDVVLKFVKESTPLPWPPTIESLTSKERESPALLQLFFNTLLSPTDSHHDVKETTKRLSDSFSQDVIHALSKGTFMTLKHASLGLGLHSLTGQELPLTILSRLGHCINYDKICEIETAQPELVQHFQSMSMSLPLIPAESGSKVSMFSFEI